MDSFLFELVERIAGSQFNGHWLLLCNGGVNYRLVFGQLPGDALEEVRDSWHQTPDEAAKAAIADELPGLFKAINHYTSSVCGDA